MPGLSPDAWAQIGTTLFNTGSQLYTNSRNRQNALKDQAALNVYNAPKQQMQRFKEAGLNPNLIYKQTNEGAAVRTTDAIAPKLDEGVLDVLGKSNNVQVQQLNMESMKLRNENQELQNDLLRSQLPDLKEKPAISNRVGNATYDNLVEGANLKRQERSQKDTINPLLVKKEEKNLKIMDQQFVALSQNNQFNQLSRPIQLKIAEATKTGLEISNDLKAFERKMQQQLDQLNIGSGLAQDIIKILVSKIKIF
jgi:hypothetical protein